MFDRHVRMHGFQNAPAEKHWPVHHVEQGLAGILLGKNSGEQVEKVLPNANWLQAWDLRVVGGVPQSNSLM